MRDMLLVLNYDSRYASALALRLRAERIDCRILPGDTPFEQVIAQEANGLVLAGGVSGDIPGSLDGRLLSSGIPILAMGDATLALAALLGGELADKQQVDAVETVTFLPSALTQGLTESERYFNWLTPLLLPEELKPLAETEQRVIGFMHASLPIHGFSFQIEPNDPDGMGILLRFAQDICGCSPWLTTSAFISSVKDRLAELAGSGTAVCAMTGGLDSGVSALLAHQVLGEGLQCVFIDTGVLREHEAEAFLSYYRDTLNMNILHINAQEKFMAALQGLTGAHEKAQAIARCYQQALNEAADKLSFDLVIRGTSANDILSTGDGYVTPGIQTDKPVFEPLREMFKEEIRLIGEALGMPQEIYQAQPFPGTGLALRIVGEVTPERLHILRRADQMFREDIKTTGLHKRLWKCFAMLYHLDDEEDPQTLAVALRAVSISSMAGIVRVLPARLPYDLVEQYGEKVIKAFPQVVRVINDVTPGQSYSQIEWR